MRLYNLENNQIRKIKGLEKNTLLQKINLSKNMNK
jgi:hypothetical protein